MLQFQLEGADFVQKQRAAVGGLKSSDRLRHRACEYASFVTEQFAVGQPTGMAAQFTATNRWCRRGPAS